MNTRPFAGKFRIEHAREGVVLAERVAPNMVLNEGANILFDNVFRNTSKFTFALVGLINGALIGGVTPPSIAATDTYTGVGSTNNWAEFTAYTDPNNGDNSSNRPYYVNVAASGGALTPTTASSFTFTSSGTVGGAFIAFGFGAQFKSDVSAGNYIWAAAMFDSPLPVASTDRLNVIYSIN